MTGYHRTRMRRPDADNRPSRLTSLGGMHRILIATVLATSGLLVACGSDGSDATLFPQCADPPAEQPTSMVLSCADGNFALEDITWDRVEADIAEGTATAVVNDCDPTCAEGTFEEFEVTVEARNPVDVDGQQVFDQISVTRSGNGSGETDFFDGLATPISG